MSSRSANEEEADFREWTREMYGMHYPRPALFTLAAHDTRESLWMFDPATFWDAGPGENLTHQAHGMQALRLACRLWELGHEVRLIVLRTADYDLWLRQQHYRDWPKHRYTWLKQQVPPPQILPGDESRADVAARRALV